MMLFCDMDGVLANFIGGFEKKFSVSFHAIPEDQAWKLIAESPEFWYELQPFNGALKFFSELLAYEPVMLTACPSQPGNIFMDTAKYKRMWVKRYLGGNIQMIPCVSGRNKAAYMHDVGDILIDDMLEKNCIPWVANGGIAIHHIEGTDYNETLYRFRKIMRV